MRYSISFTLSVSRSVIRLRVSNPSMFEVWLYSCWKGLRGVYFWLVQGSREWYQYLLLEVQNISMWTTVITHSCVTCVVRTSRVLRHAQAEILEVDMPTHAIGASDVFLLCESLSNGCSKCHIVFFLSWTPMQVPLSFFTLRKYRNTK